MQDLTNSSLSPNSLLTQPLRQLNLTSPADCERFIEENYTQLAALAWHASWQVGLGKCVLFLVDGLDAMLPTSQVIPGALTYRKKIYLETALQATKLLGLFVPAFDKKTSLQILVDGGYTGVLQKQLVTAFDTYQPKREFIILIGYANSLVLYQAPNSPGQLTPPQAFALVNTQAQSQSPVSNQTEAVTEKTPVGKGKTNFE